MTWSIRRLTAVIAFFSFIPLAVSGLAMLLLPHGGGLGRGGARGFGRGLSQTVDFLGISRSDWGEFHEIAGIVFLIAAVVHLSCNWRAMKRHLGLRGPERGSAAARDYL